MSKSFGDSHEITQIFSTFCRVLLFTGQQVVHFLLIGWSLDTFCSQLIVKRYGRKRYISVYSTIFKPSFSLFTNSITIAELNWIQQDVDKRLFVVLEGSHLCGCCIMDSVAA